MYRLTLNVLLSLIVQAKITGKGRIGNGRLFIRLLSVLADCPNLDMTRERNLLALLSSHADKQSAYRQLNRLLFDFIPTGIGCPVDRITVQTFEKNVGIGRKPNWERYRHYLAEAGDFCEEILDKEKAPAFVNTLLGLLKQDDDTKSVFYANAFIPKSRLSGTPAHQKKICIEALLLGALYHALKDVTPADAREISLLYAERLPFRVVWLGTRENAIFWGDYEALKNILDLEQHVSIAESLQTAPVSENTFCYPVQIRCHEKEFLMRPENGLYPSLFHQQKGKYLLLYASGGMGKTFLMRYQEGLSLSLLNYREEIHEAIHPGIACWILIQLLLKYHYQYTYQSYELCAACEGEEILLRQLAELISFFRNTPESWAPKYTLLLDGMNEISPDLQDSFAEELAYLCKTWHNVRIIVSSRTIPQQDIFSDFEILEITGIPDTIRDELLSEYPEIMQNERLLEILKTPLFLKYFLQNQGRHDTLNTRGEILDAYFSNQIRQCEKPLQFVVKYALPFLAYQMDFHLNIRRSDVSDAIEQTFEFYLKNEHVYQNFIAPEGFRKKSLLKAKESTDFVELLIEKLGILVVIDNQLRFAHEYLLYYFVARYIVNAVHTVQAVNSREVFDDFMLTDIWWHCIDEPYILLGEICRDYRNIPDKNGVLHYQRTELDILLDMARKFHVNGGILYNVIQTMSFARNRLICGADFSHLPLSLVHSNIKFSDNGRYPSSFQGCRICFFPKCNCMIHCATYTSDGKRLLLGMEDGHVLVWDVRAGYILHDYNLHAYLKYPECFQNAEFLSDDMQFMIATEYTRFLIETDTGVILERKPEKTSLPYPRHTATLSPDYLHFVIDDTICSVTGERQKITCKERYNHFRNCDFRNITFLFHNAEDIKALRESGAILEQSDNYT